MQKKFILYDLSGISSKNRTEKEPVNSDSFRLLTPLSQSLGTCSVVFLRAPVIVSMPLLIVHFAIVVSLIINE